MPKIIPSISVITSQGMKMMKYLKEVFPSPVLSAIIAEKMSEYSVNSRYGVCVECMNYVEVSDMCPVCGSDNSIIRISKRSLAEFFKKETDGIIHFLSTNMSQNSIIGMDHTMKVIIDKLREIQQGPPYE